MVEKLFKVVSKLRRINGDSNKVFVSKIYKDIERLKQIKSEMQTPNNFPMFLVVFDKKCDIKNDVKEIQSTLNNDMYLYYKFSQFNGSIG